MIVPNPRSYLTKTRVDLCFRHKVSCPVFDDIVMQQCLNHQIINGLLPCFEALALNWRIRWLMRLHKLGLRSRRCRRRWWMSRKNEIRATVAGTTCTDFAGYRGHAGTAGASMQAYNAYRLDILVRRPVLTCCEISGADLEHYIDRF